MSSEPRDPMQRFDDALRRWAARPPRRSPEAAARRLAVQLTARRRRRLPSPAWRWAAAAVALVLVAGLLWSLSGSPGGPSAVADGGELAVPPLDPEVALIWLDAETPLYLSMTPPPSGRQGGSS